MAKEYKFDGEPFFVDNSAGCQINVSDKFKAVSITPNNGGPSVYKVSTVKGGWWWHTNTVEESVNRACRELIESRKAISPEDACAALGEFVDQL